MAARVGAAGWSESDGVPGGQGRSISIQPVLAASSAPAVSEVSVFPHHPITCAGELRFDPDGQFSCAHASATPGDQRTQHCIDHSVALLLIELAHEM